MAFGRDAAWFAVAADDAAAVAKALALRTVLPANWRAGLADARQVGTFVSPPVDGLVFVTGADVLALRDFDGDVAPRLECLAARFGEATWFCCDQEVERFGWARARGGEVRRGYAFAGEQGAVAWRGEVDDAERALGCHIDDPRDRSDDDVKWWPDRRIVHALAAAWSRDPDALSAGGAGCGVGVVGRMGPTPTA